MNVVLDKETNATMQSWKSSSEKKDRRSTVVDRIEETPVVGNLGKEPLRLRLVRGRRGALLHPQRQGPGLSAPTLT